MAPCAKVSLRNTSRLFLTKAGSGSSAITLSGLYSLTISSTFLVITYILVYTFALPEAATYEWISLLPSSTAIPVLFVLISRAKIFISWSPYIDFLSKDRIPKFFSLVKFILRRANNKRFLQGGVHFFKNYNFAKVLNRFAILDNKKHGNLPAAAYIKERGFIFSWFR